MFRTSITKLAGAGTGGLMGKYPVPTIRNKGTYLDKKNEGLPDVSTAGRSARELQSYISKQKEGTLKTASCNIILTNEVMSSFFEKISAMAGSMTMGKSSSSAAPASNTGLVKTNPTPVAATPSMPTMKAPKSSVPNMSAPTQYKNTAAVQRTVLQTGIPR